MVMTTEKTPSQKHNLIMAILLCQVLVASAMVNRIFSLPTGTQALLSTLAEEKLPQFGVGFDLTASYGYDPESNAQKVLLLTG